MTGIKLEDIETKIYRHHIICTYIAKDGSIINEFYTCKLPEAKKAFQHYINSNKLQ
jgi:hypothetical protein